MQAYLTTPDDVDIPAVLNWTAYNMTREKFYAHLKANFKKYKSSPASVVEMFAYGEQFLSRGQDLLMIGISGIMSATYTIMLHAAKMLEKKYPDRKVIVIDSKKYSVAIGLLIIKACEFRKQGLGIEETAQKIEEIKDSMHQMGTMDDLFYIASKGRISNAKAILGTLAKIRTFADFGSDGMVNVIGKVSGFKKARKISLEYIKRTIIDPENQIVIVGHSDRLKQAQEFVELLKDHVPIKEVILQDIYPVTGINTGPGLVAAYYFGAPITDLEAEKSILNQIIKGK